MDAISEAKTLLGQPVTFSYGNETIEVRRPLWKEWPEVAKLAQKVSDDPLLTMTVKGGKEAFEKLLDMALTENQKKAVENWPVDVVFAIVAEFSGHAGLKKELARLQPMNTVGVGS